MNQIIDVPAKKPVSKPPESADCPFCQGDSLPCACFDINEQPTATLTEVSIALRESLRREPPVSSVIENGLLWTEDLDDGGNTVWEAASPVGDEEDGAFSYRIKQRLVDNAIEFYGASDEEIGAEFDGPWDTIQDAKKEISEWNSEFVVQLAKTEAN